MSLGIRETIVLLKEHHLLKSVTLAKDTDQAFKAVTYDSRQVTADTLFFL